MDDSPRSSKRRKLDTPTRNSSLQIPKSTQRTPSSRLAKRAISLANESSTDVAEEVSTPTRRTSRKLAQTPNGVPKATLRGSRAVQEKDVYDDIEGALSQQNVSPAPSPAATGKTSIRKRKKTVWDPAKPHPFKSSPSKLAQKANAEEDTIVVQSSNRSSFRDLVNGFKHGPDTDAATQDELAVEDMTPTRRKKRIVMTPNGTPGSLRQVRSAVSNGPSGRKTQSSAGGKQQADATSDQLQSNGYDGTISMKARGRPKNTKAVAALAMGAENEEPLVVSPSKSAKSRAPVQESEDELGDHNPPSRTRTARERRRANRADHTQNRDEENTVDAIEQVDDDLPVVHEDNDEAPDVDGHSIMDSVLDPTEPSPFNKPSPLLKKQDASALLQTSIGEGRPLELLKTIVMDRITRKRPTPLIGLDEEFKSVYQLVENTITAGEGNSMLVIGARGSGKTALVDKVLSEVAKDNREDFHVVRLNGFIHTDDKITLREIWRQLGKEMDVEEDGGVGKNDADTLTTLLALLSHPSEQTDEATDQVAKAVVFVMDEFDLFATHPRQTLLYNLFDIAQSRKAPIAVLGLTTRIDVVNSLEKRVKSRFSHRYVHLSLAKTFTTFQEICKASLLVQPDQLSIEERAILTAPPTTTPSRGRKSKETKQAAKEDALPVWNSNIAALFASKSFLTNHLAPHFYLTKSISTVLTTFLYPTCILSSATPISSSLAESLTPPDSKLTLLTNLSTLALSLLIAAARLDIIHDADTCNFNMCYDEYVTLASKARIQAAAGGASASGSVTKVWGKEVARREWEELIELGLVIPVITGRTGGFDMVRADVALEEIGAVIAGDKGVEKALERWCKQI